MNHKNLREKFQRLSRLIHEDLIKQGIIHNFHFERYDDEIEKYLIYLDYKKHIKLELGTHSLSCPVDNEDIKLVIGILLCASETIEEVEMREENRRREEEREEKRRKRREKKRRKEAEKAEKSSIEEKNDEEKQRRSKRRIVTRRRLLRRLKI